MDGAAPKCELPSFIHMCVEEFYVDEGGGSLEIYMFPLKLDFTSYTESAMPFLLL